MGGLTSILGGLVLLAIAVATYILSGGFGMSVIVLLVGAAVLFLRGAQGRGISQAGGDAIAPMDFVSNPAEAIVDAVAERVPGLGPKRKAKDIEEPVSTFDADAALARYLAKRPADLPPIVPPAAAPFAEPAPRRGFGRKGL